MRGAAPITLLLAVLLALVGCGGESTTVVQKTVTEPSSTSTTKKST
jgi:hypothetical protein